MGGGEAEGDEEGQPRPETAPTLRLPSTWHRRIPYHCLQQTLGALSPKASFFVSLRSERAPCLARPLASLLQKFVPLKCSVVVSRPHFFFLIKGKETHRCFLGIKWCCKIMILMSLE